MARPPLVTAQLNDSGQATISISTLSVGPHAITVAYSGDGNFITSSTTTALTQTVNKATTKTTVLSSTSPTMNGQSVTFTATVTPITPVAPGTVAPTGNVTFTITSNGKTPSSGVAQLMVMSNGADEATFTTTFLNAGTYKITAVYAGDTNFTKSTSAVFTQTVK